MLTFGSLLLFVLSGAIIQATNTSGDPTDLANWPPCAQKCIPIGLAAPASCQSLSNITCICQNPAFSLSTNGCEKCSAEELNQVQKLSTRLCAPVGGLAPSVNSALGSYLATASFTAAGVPTSLPADATAVTAVSAILASATITPNRGNPADLSNYPSCAQTCSNEVLPRVECDVNDITCLCGPMSRALTAACEEVSCNASDVLSVSLLAQELCGPVYSESPALSSSVSSAIASATAAAAAAVASKDPTNIASLPLCAQNCVNEALPLSGCGSLSNRKCVCQTSNFNANVGPCEIANCSTADLQVTADIAYELCNPVGGIGNASNTSVSPSTPTPSPFTGDAAGTVPEHLGWVLVALFGALMGSAVLLS